MEHNMLTPMSPNDFQSALNKYLDFHRTYLFRVLFFDGVVGALTGALTTELVSSTDTPVSTTASINLGWFGSKLKIAGKTDYTDWKVVIRDDATNVAYTYFQNWRDKVYNVKTGASSKIAATGLASTLGLGTGYKKSAIVMLLANRQSNSTGSAGLQMGSTISAAVTTRSYILQGIWPKEVGPIALDYSTENIATFPVTFSMDYYEPYSLASVASDFLSSVFKI
jgi:hypothetical protein